SPDPSTPYESSGANRCCGNLSRKIYHKMMKTQRGTRGLPPRPPFLPEPDAVDDVFESAAVLVELVLRRHAHEVIKGAIGREGGDDPVRLTSTGRGLVRCFGQISLLPARTDALMAARDPHVWIRSLEIVQQLVGGLRE